MKPAAKAPVADKEENKISKEEAIKKYKESNKKSLELEIEAQNLSEVEEESLSEETSPATVEIHSEDEAQEQVTAAEQSDEKSNNFVADNQLEEYNPDDEDEREDEGSYSYGWGYSDSFDDPEEESLASEYGDLDEDEMYAKGIKPKTKPS